LFAFMPFLIARVPLGFWTLLPVTTGMPLKSLMPSSTVVRTVSRTDTDDNTRTGYASSGALNPTLRAPITVARPQRHDIDRGRSPVSRRTARPLL
jgi:hypothetical protein